MALSITFFVIGPGVSSVLDTPGPMTNNVIDPAIFLAAMTGEDNDDIVTMCFAQETNYLKDLKLSSLKGKRLGVMKQLLSDSIFKATVQKIKEAGAVIIEYEPPKVSLKGFTTLLNIDMINDLPNYLENFADESIQIKILDDVVKLNLLDTLKRAPYGQELFEGILRDSTSNEDFESIKSNLHTNGKIFWDTPFQEFNLDAILSINNYHAGYAAVAKYPCITVPMGYKEDGEPVNMTFIGTPFSEQKLLQVGYAFEKLMKARKLPENYK